MGALLESNIKDVALVFEGGSMRVSYTAPVVAALVEHELWFDYVAGISAGASNAVNYLSRDARRAKKCFVEFGADPNFGSWFTWLQGKGRFNAEYVYEHTCGANEVLPFDFETFAANPAQLRIGTFDVAAGTEVWWSEADCRTQRDLMVRVRSSSSMPLLMPPTFIDGRMYYDGACGANAGIPLGVAQADGFERFFIVLSQPRDYKKIPDAPALLIKTLLRKHPALVDGLLERTARYENIRAEIAALEAAGKAYVFYPDRIPYPDATQNVKQLKANYAAGESQIARELPSLLAWLNS
ncbi:MAG: patatin family protein [Propionibacteriaceae bacterium]|nr:patatin family protein [Propionibacteriaceae bacterium]